MHLYKNDNNNSGLKNNLDKMLKRNKCLYNLWLYKI